MELEQVPLFALDGKTPNMCTIPDFAKVHDVPVQTLYSAYQSGRILHTRLHGRVYLDIESAEKFMITYRKYAKES